MRRSYVAIQVGGAVAAVTAAAVPLLLGPAPGANLNEAAIALTVAAYAVVALVLRLTRPDERVGLLLWAGSLVWGTGEALLAVGVAAASHDVATVAGLTAVLGTVARGLGWLVLVVVVALVFPDGRTAWPHRRWPQLLAVGSLGAFSLGAALSAEPLDDRMAGVDNPLALPAQLSLVADLLAVGGLAASTCLLGVAVGGLVTKWRRGDPLDRQRLLWFVIAFLPPLLFMPLIATSVAEPWMFAVVSLPVPVSIGVSVLQRRLYDIHLVLSRSLTYLAVSVLIATVYGAVVLGVGVLLDEQGAAWLPWVAAALVAVAFAPLRDTLQRGANKLVYGRWSDPHEILAVTGRRLADAGDVPALLDDLTTTLGSELALARVEVTDAAGGVVSSWAAASPAAAGNGIEDDTDLLAYGRPVGRLSWAGPPLRAQDRALMVDLAGQLGAVIHAGQLLGDLRRSQERLVLAREEERRRLRHDLHDDLGPALASLTLRVDTLRNRLHDPTLDLDHELVELRGGIQGAVVDVRRVIEGLRPPALDDLGLVGALEQAAHRLVDPTEMSLHLDLQPDPDEISRLPAAVEVALYRIAHEAMNNVVRHAGASTMGVALRTCPEEVHLVVNDDGRGTPGVSRGGIGLPSMRERAVALGGELCVRRGEQGGTWVEARFPLGGAS